MLTGAVIGIVVACVGLVVVAIRQSRQQKALTAELAASGIAMQQGAGALQVPPNPLMPPSKLQVSWSAVIPNQPVINLYSIGTTIVVAWRTAHAHPGAFVVTTPMGANQAPALLHKVPKKELPRKLQVFSSHPSVTARIVNTGLLAAFETRFGRGRPWYFTCVEGNCYAYSSDNTWTGLDDLRRTVGMLEYSLAG